MPTILGTTPRTWKSVRHIHELMFSIYFSLLLILADDVSSKWVGNPGDRTPWVLRMKFLLTGDYRTHSLVADPKLRLAFVFLWAVLSLGIFLLLRVLARFSLTRAFLRIAAGVIVVAGFPLIFAYGCHTLIFLLFLVEAVAALVCTVFYACGNSPSSALWAISLAVLHFTFWSWCTWNGDYCSPGWMGGVPLFWPGYTLTWVTVKDPLLIYPWLGLLATIVWGLYVRQSEETGQHADYSGGRTDGH
jgi:hypothetical protein